MFHMVDFLQEFTDDRWLPAQMAHNAKKGLNVMTPS